MNTATVQAKKRIIILGAKGNIGNALSNEFNRKPELFNVSGTSRNKESNNELISFDPFKDDWNTLGKFDIIINCIGMIRESSGNSFHKIHVDLVKLILKNRQLIGKPVIIQVSALGADKNHPVEFLRTKGIADELLLKEENTYAIRPSVVCFPETMLLKKLIQLRKITKKTGNYLLLPEGFLQHKIQPVLINDLVKTIVNSTDKNSNHRLINVAGSEPISYYDLIRTAVNNVRIKEVNRQLFKTFVKIFIAPLFPSLLNYEQYQLLFYDNVAETKEAEEILGRKFSSTKEFWQNNLK